MEHIDESGFTEEEQARIEHTDTAVVVTLLEPLIFKPSKMDDERTLDKLTLPRKVLGKHLKAMDQASGELGKSLALVAALARIPARAAEELDARDVDLIMGVMEPFLPRLRATGKF
nr:phage tail assembly protein [Alcaligenes faecalis]